MKDSKIEWTHHTFNPWWGCKKVSPGCKNCYAEKLDGRYNSMNKHWGPESDRKPMSDAYWNQPLKWNKQAEKEGVKHRVFTASMADVFEMHDQVKKYRKKLFKLIEKTPNLIWLLLTKRPENVLKFVPRKFKKNGWPENIWIGTSVENQEYADKRIPLLLKIPSKVRFLSMEPLIGPVNLHVINANTFLGIYTDCLRGVEIDNGKQILLPHKIDWVIAGGESGHGSRPMLPLWVSSLQKECSITETPFFFKQWGEYNMKLEKVGKKNSGNEINGLKFNEFPNLK